MELVPRPIWAIDLSDSVQRPVAATESPVFWFRVGNTFGFLELSGNLRLRDRVLYDVTLSDSGFINYSSVPSNLVLLNTIGDFVRSYPYSGYPVLDPPGNQIFVLNSESTGLLKVSRETEKVWRAEFASLITSLDVSDKFAVLGLLSGELKLFNSQGDQIYETEVTGSRIPVVYGCALKPGTDEFAAVAGIDPQKLLVVKRDSARAAQIDAVELASSFRRQVFIRYSNNGELIYFESDSGISVFEVKTRRIINLPVAGTFLGMGESPGEGIISLLSEVGNRKEIRLYTPGGALKYREAVDCRNISVRHVQGHVILGCDNHVARIDLVEE